MLAEDLKDDFLAELNKANPGDVIYRWINRINKNMYREMYKIFPEKYISESTITNIYALTLTSIVGTFTVGENLTSGANTARLVSKTGSAATIDTVSGIEAGDTITGVTSGATAVISTKTEIYTHPLPSDFEDILAHGCGVFQLDSNSDILYQLRETNKGSQKLGFWMTDDELTRTPENTLSNNWLLRYVPKIDEITAENADTESMIFPDRLKEESIEVIYRFLTEMYEIKFETSDGLVGRADQLMSAAMSNFRKLFKTSRNTLRIDPMGIHDRIPVNRLKYYPPA